MQRTIEVLHKSCTQQNFCQEFEVYLQIKELTSQSLKYTQILKKAEDRYSTQVASRKSPSNDGTRQKTEHS